MKLSAELVLAQSRTTTRHLNSPYLTEVCNTNYCTETHQLPYGWTVRSLLCHKTYWFIRLCTNQNVHSDMLTRDHMLIPLKVKEKLMQCTGQIGRWIAPFCGSAVLNNWFCMGPRKQPLINRTEDVLNRFWRPVLIWFHCVLEDSATYF